MLKCSTIHNKFLNCFKCVVVVYLAKVHSSLVVCYEIMIFKPTQYLPIYFHNCSRRIPVQVNLSDPYQYVEIPLHCAHNSHNWLSPSAVMSDHLVHYPEYFEVYFPPPF